MFKISLQYNKGFKWNDSKNVHSKGYIYIKGKGSDKKEKLYKGKNLNRYFNSKIESNFINKLITFNGSFAVVIESKNKLFAFTDRLRSIPLFYALQNNVFYLSDNAFWIKEQIGLKEFDRASEQEFLLTGYVTDKNTLFEKIKQIQAGEYLVAEKEGGKITIKTERYHRYLYKKFFTESKEELFDKLDNVSKNLINRLIKSVEGKTIVLALSGGYDSRYVVTMLKKSNYKNVICFSYGRKGNWESKISKIIAKKLGYEWHFVEYTKNKWRNWSSSDEWKKYLKYGNNLASVAFLQDWPAVWELKKENKIPDDAVFVTGQLGDVLGGSETPKPLNMFKRDHNLKDVSDYLFKSRYFLSRLKNKHKKDFFLKRTVKELGNLELSDVDNFVGLCDCWNISNYHAKFLINSMRIYEFFDYEWRIPLGDYERMDFWSKVPLRYKIKKELYEEYLFERLFKEYGVSFIKKTNKRMKKYKSLMKKIKPLYPVAIKMLHIKKYLFDYYTYTKNWYAIVSPYKYYKMSSLNGNINSILAKITIENLKKTW